MLMGCAAEFGGWDKASSDGGWISAMFCWTAEDFDDIRCSKKVRQVFAFCIVI